MQENNVTSVREVFENMSTEQLDEILNRELHADPPDANSIRLILSILREREKDMPIELTPQMLEAWEQYKRDTAKLRKQSRRVKRMRSMFVRIVSSAAVLVMVLMMLIPQEAKAKGLWDWFRRMTADVVEFFTPADTESRIMEYEFKTDNPGLQEVYDTAVELGVDYPVVPMWLPEGNKLTECRIIETPAKKGLIATFVDNGNHTVFRIEMFSQEVAHSFEKDDIPLEKVEIERREFNIMHNNEVWTAVWGERNVECSIAIDCQEDTLYKVLKSIYVMEDE